MPETTITVRVPEQVAKAFAADTEQGRIKLELLLNLYLRELNEHPPRPLKEIMDEAGMRAEARGLTDGELESILE